LGNDKGNPNPRLTNSEEAPSQSADAAWPRTTFASQRERRTTDLTRERRSGRIEVANDRNGCGLSIGVVFRRVKEWVRERERE